MDLIGKVIAVLQPKSGVSAKSGNQWMSQEYVIEIPGQYTKKCVFTIFGQDRIQQFNLQMGETVTVSIDIDAHEYNGRWFNEVRAINVVRPQMQGCQQMPQQGYQQQPMQQQAPFPQQGQQMQQPFNSGQPAPNAQQGAQQPLPFPPAQ